jgi:hypothetical protein
MSLKTIETQPLTTYFQPLIGQAAWGVALGQGSFVTMEFGAPMESMKSADTPQQPHGTWHFWVYCCAWRLETPDDVLGYSEGERSRLLSVLALLEGAVLEGVQINLPGGDTVLQFAGRLMLRLMPIHAETYEHWFLYTPEGVLVSGPGTHWQFEMAA